MCIRDRRGLVGTHDPSWSIRRATREARRLQPVSTMAPLTVHWFEGQMRRPDRLRRGLSALAAIAAGYAVAIVLLALGGAAPGTAPWLALPTETYFYWEATFIAPVIFAAGLLAAATMQLLARAAGGRGSFEGTLALLGPAIAISTLATLIPDTGIALALIAGVVEPAVWMRGITSASWVLAAVWVYLVAYVTCFLVAFPVVARVAHGLRGGRALAVGWATFAVYQLFLYVFVR